MMEKTFSYGNGHSFPAKVTGAMLKPLSLQEVARAILTLPSFPKVTSLVPKLPPLQGEGRGGDGLTELYSLSPGCATLVHSLLVFLILTFFSPSMAPGAEPTVLFRENFDSLAQWEPLTFPKIKAHSTYTLVQEGGKSILKTESRASASALVYRRTFNIYENPRIRWRWKVTQLSDKGNPKEKTGDDYPIRLYVMFQYDPARATLGNRLIYGATKVIYGKYPPHSTLNYVWTGHSLPERIIASPYTDKARIVVLEKGKQRVGQWVEESVNVLEDYRQAFGKDPPAIAGIAVMSDTDNTGESAVAYLDFIEIGR
ncbi:MAG: DUF3047 domain-containing protein [Syntrophales bacterium]|nr:DUF3047 domain-containing protein [Syntrophales bacterium]